MNRSSTLRGRLVVVLAAVAAGTLVGVAPASAAGAAAAGGVGCAPIVQLQSLIIPTATGPRRSAQALLPDDGGTLPPVVTVVERRTATADELDLVIATGTAVTVRQLYLAPGGCVIAWSHDVHPLAAPEGRRSVRTPAFTVRLGALAAPTCSRCMRMA
jgi:hypothetical protein